LRNRVHAVVVLASLGFVGASPASPSAAASAGPQLTVEGTSFVLRNPDGTELRSAQLVGAELDLGDGVEVRIDAVRPDPGDKSGETLLHALSVRGADGWTSLCDADREGRREGFPLAGRWDGEGRYHAEDAATHFALTCTSGAQAKCVRFGYKPWKAAPDGAPMLPLYESCIHMVRANYCGDGTPTTRDGTRIDIFDRHGVQRPESGPERHAEATREELPAARPGARHELQRRVGGQARRRALQPLALAFVPRPGSRATPSRGARLRRR
jgi:hypothetical protein